MTAYPSGTLGYPRLGFGGYAVDAPGNNPTLDVMVNGDGGPSAGGGYYYPLGVTTAWFPCWENFSGSWTLNSINSNLGPNIANAASPTYAPDIGPASGANLVVGSWTTSASDGSYSPASICAGQQDTYFQQYIDIFANNGYTTTNGYTGTIFLRINWEMNYPATTPGNYNSSQTGISGWIQPEGQAWAWGNDGVPGTSNYGTGMIGAWRHMVGVLRAEAAAKNVPIAIVWNPTILNGSAGSGQIWGSPDHMYPGDDVVDVHGADIYSNGLYPLSWDDHPGYINQPPFTTGSPRQASGVNSPNPWGNHTGDYSNSAYYFDFTDDNGFNSDGLSAWGWGLYKAFTFALVQGPYANATNPDGSPRVKKPFCFPESGGLGAQGGGNGPWAITNAVGYPVCDDPFFYPYMKSRIAWFQQQGGDFLFTIIWTGPNDTTAGPNMAASFGTTWPATSGPAPTPPPAANMGPVTWSGTATASGIPASYRVYSPNGQVRIQGTVGPSSEMKIGPAGNSAITTGSTVTFSTVTITENGNA